MLELQQVRDIENYIKSLFFYVSAKMILDSSENEINRSFDVNVKAHFYVSEFKVII